mmetsp:Transcript_11308/g.36193  ORF Transcript_11308/g.36193 Transcript_11308/m.36193 type:complete len:285 (+) Transcript_11308:196-1050(+)
MPRDQRPETQGEEREGGREGGRGPPQRASAEAFQLVALERRVRLELNVHVGISKHLLQLGHDTLARHARVHQRRAGGERPRGDHPQVRHAVRRHLEHGGHQFRLETAGREDLREAGGEGGDDGAEQVRLLARQRRHDGQQRLLGPRLPKAAQAADLCHQHHPVLPHQRARVGGAPGANLSKVGPKLRRAKRRRELRQQVQDHVPHAPILVRPEPLQQRQHRRRLAVQADHVDERPELHDDCEPHVGELVVRQQREARQHVLQRRRLAERRGELDADRGQLDARD